MTSTAESYHETMTLLTNPSTSYEHRNVKESDCAQKEPGTNGDDDWVEIVDQVEKEYEPWDFL